MKGSSKKKKGKKVEVKDNFEIKGIVLIGVGLLCFIGIYTDIAGFLSNVLQKIGNLLLGFGAYLLPIYIIYLSIMYLIGRGTIKLNKKFYGVTLFLGVIILFLGTLYLQNGPDPDNFNVNFSNIIDSSINNKGIILHGGLISFFITYFLYKFIGGIGSYILYSCIIIISAIITFEISIMELFSSSITSSKEKKSKKMKNKSKNNNEEYKSNNNNTKSSFINIVDKDNEDSLEKKEFLNEVNSKIKILDFMKNSSMEEELEEVVADEYIDKDINKSVNEVKKSVRKNGKERLGNDIKDDINKEINSKINESKDSESNISYIFPSTDLLEKRSTKVEDSDGKKLIDRAGTLVEILSNFGVSVEVTEVTRGPSVTRYELQPSPGVKVSKIVNLADDIALGLAASGVRIEAPIPGKAAVGIEVPNKKQTAVYLREVLESDAFKKSDKKLAFALGKGIAGESVIGDLSKMPHTLIAGATGSGKSVCINTLIISLLYKYSPDEVKLLLVDPKVVELNVYNGIPHLLIPVVTEPKKAAAALNWAVNEMNKRYNLFAENGVRNIDSYNKLVEKGKVQEKLPYVVIIVDELADLMMVCANDVEDYIGRLAQMARAAGMHLVIATQRPSVDVITGVIKANIPSRISFAVSSQIDSRTILDSSGAEKLLGRGDMLYYPVGESKPLRVQGCFISEEEVENVVEFIKNQGEEAEYKEEILEHINNEAEGKVLDEGDDCDELLPQAMEIVVEFQQASTSFIQRRLRIGFNRASRIMDQLEERGVISPREGSKPRTVLLKKEDLIDNNGNE